MGSQLRNKGRDVTTCVFTRHPRIGLSQVPKDYSRLTLEPDTRSSQADETDEEVPKVQSSTARQKPPKQEIPAKKKQKYYPKGLSLSKVSQRGALPTCQGCQMPIDRASIRLVNKEVVNQTNGFTRVESYHLQAGCLECLPPELHEQAIELWEAEGGRP
jgi:hypothetical protein